MYLNPAHSAAETVSVPINTAPTAEQEWTEVKIDGYTNYPLQRWRI